MAKKPTKTSAQRTVVNKIIEDAAPVAAAAGSAMYKAKKGVNLKFSLPESLLKDLLNADKLKGAAWDKGNKRVTFDLSSFYLKFDLNDLQKLNVEPDSGTCKTFTFEK